MAEAGSAASVGDEPGEIERALERLSSDGSLTAIMTSPQKERFNAFLEALQHQPLSHPRRRTSRRLKFSTEGLRKESEMNKMEVELKKFELDNKQTELKMLKLRNPEERKRADYILLQELLNKSESEARKAEQLKAEREDRARQRTEERAHEIRLAELSNEDNEKTRDAERRRAERADRVRQEEYERAREAEQARAEREDRIRQEGFQREDRVRQENYERDREAEIRRRAHEIRMAELSNENNERAREAERFGAEREDRQRAEERAHAIRTAELSNEDNEGAREAERFGAEREDRQRAGERAHAIRMAELSNEDNEGAREAERLRAERENRAKQENYERAREAERHRVENEATRRKDEIRQMELRLQADRDEMIYKVVKCVAIAAAIGVAIYFTPAVVNALATYGPAISETICGIAEQLSFAVAKFHVERALPETPDKVAALVRALQSQGVPQDLTKLLLQSSAKVGMSFP